MPAGALAASAYLTVVVLAALFADVVSPHDPLAIDPNNILASPNARNLLGTDELGAICLRASSMAAGFLSRLPFPRSVLQA